MSWLLWIAIVLGALVALLAALFFISEVNAKKRHREALAARGAAIGQWTVYYDVKGKRIGLAASFGAEALMRYLLFRAHDLFDYNRGLEAERRKLAESLRAVASGQAPSAWEFVFQPAPTDCYHGKNSPTGTLFKFFEGTLYEHAVDQPRFIGGDSIAKQEGLVGECLALIGHLRQEPVWSGKIERAIESFIDRELRETQPPAGARFWSCPNDVLAAMS